MCFLAANNYKVYETMTLINNKWYNMWKDQETPLSREVDPDYRSRFTKEMLVLLGDVSGKSVLEFGCGDGLMYESYGFHKADYMGVDFSDRLLEKFKSRYPQVKLKQSSAEDFKIEQKFDIIFSCGMVQYLTPAKLERHVGHISKMLNKGGMVILASIPWKDARASFYRNDTAEQEERSLIRFILVYLKSTIINTMGHWYSMKCLRKIAKNNGFNFTFYGSLHYPYRIHMVLQ